MERLQVNILRISEISGIKQTDRAIATEPYFTTTNQMWIIVTEWDP